MVTSLTETSDQTNKSFFYTNFAVLLFNTIILFYHLIFLKKKDLLNTSFGFLCAAHKNIHCSVAVICTHVVGVHSCCNATVIRFKSKQNCRNCSYFHTPSS